MVNETVLIRDKKRKLKKFSRIFLAIVLVLIVLSAVFLFGFLKSGKKLEIVLENPLKEIIFANTNEAGKVNYNAVLEQGVLDFNEDYINYLLVALGVNNLHKSYIGYGNPVVEFVVDDEIWTSELDNGLNTLKGAGDNEDLRISVSREEAVNAILSSDIEQFMRDSVADGKTRIEMIAGKVELGSKGYLTMYTELTGEVVELDK